MVKEVGLPLGILERMPSRHWKRYFIIEVVIIGGYRFIARRWISFLEDITRFIGGTEGIASSAEGIASSAEGIHH